MIQKRELLIQEFSLLIKYALNFSYIVTGSR